MERADTISIRGAEEGDAAALASLSTQLGYPADADTMRRRLHRLRDHRIGEVFVAVNDELRVVGWTHVVDRFPLEDEPFVELAGLVVDETMRSAGVGAALLRAAEAWARERDHATLRVRSNMMRDRAHGFYRREGYIERKQQMVFEKALR